MSGFPQDTIPAVTLVAAKGPAHALVTGITKTARKILAARFPENTMRQAG